MSKGFITIATGKEEYYILAQNLLKSYRYFTNDRLPFAILCDRENEYTKEFDEVILYKNGATNSYLDKLSLGEYLPFDENIFIDADCLAYSNLNTLFERFAKADDFCCFGRVLPLDDKTGWFEYKNLGDLRDSVSYVVGLHGGIYYMRKGDTTNRIFESAKRFVPDYQSFKFKGKFDTPGDEPLVALAMAVNDCHPIPHSLGTICCYWEYVDKMDIDISKGKAVVITEDKINTNLVHWGTRYTRGLEYKKQCNILEVLLSDSTEKEKTITRIIRRYNWNIRYEKIQKLLNRIFIKIKKVLHLK